MDVSASILSANFLRLEDDINFLNKYDIDTIHVDVMDGNFVENITWGHSTVKLIKEVSKIPLDIHLLIDKPESRIEEYLAIKPYFIYIHPESTIFLRKTLLAIKERGIKAGIALKLETPVNALKHCTDLIDGVLLLSSDEGFGGNKFNELTIEKLKDIKRLNFHNEALEIVIDGGINSETSQVVKKAGATKVVSGSYLFDNRDNIEKTIKGLR